MALQSDAALAAARSDRQAAEADQSAAQRQRWPALDLNGTYTQFEHAPNLDIATSAGQLEAPDLAPRRVCAGRRRCFGSHLDVRQDQRCDRRGHRRRTRRLRAGDAKHRGSQARGCGIVRRGISRAPRPEGCRVQRRQSPGPRERRAGDVRQAGGAPVGCAGRAGRAGECHAAAPARRECVAPRHGRL